MNVAHNIEVNDEDKFIIGAQQGANLQDNANGYFLKADSAGSIISSFTYGTSGDDLIKHLALLKDGNYLTWGSAYTTLNNDEYQWAGFVAKLNPSGNTIWRTFVSKPKRHHIWQVRELEDGSIVFIGEAVYQGINEDAGWIAKLDANGNLLWERLHIYKERPFFWREAKFKEDFKQTSDGGFIVTGVVWRQSDTTQPSVYTQHIWLVKLDSLGCLNGDCGITVGMGEVARSKAQDASIVVYPNPFKYSALVSIRANQHPNEEVVFQLYDAAGRLIRTQRQMLNGYGYGEFYLQRENLAGGVYIYNVVSKNEVIGRGKIIVQ